MVLAIKHTADWELICRKNQAKRNKENIRENIKRVDHDYKVQDKFIITNNAAFKYYAPYKVPFEINKYWTNGTVRFQCGATKIRYNILHISHINLIQMSRILIPKMMYDDVNI